MKKLLLLIAAGAACAVGVRPAVSLEPAAAQARVDADIRFLASDELEGRGPETPGLQKAAERLRQVFREAGLRSGVEDGSYFQPFDIVVDVKPVAARTQLVLEGPGGERLALEVERDFQPLAAGGDGQAEAEVVFAGYGISAPKLDYDDFAGADVAGKIVLVIRREPQQDQPKSAFDGKKVTPHSYIRTKLQAAKKQRAAGILLVNDWAATKAGKGDALTTPNGFGSGGPSLPFAHLTQESVNRMLAVSPLSDGAMKLSSLEAVEARIDERLQPLTQATGWKARLHCEFEDVKADVANVVGVLEGAGPLAEETIVIGAHYDHLGYGPYGSRKPEQRAIHNGADDNATGTAAIMELARRFAAQGPPARRLVFIGFSAEERGIVGSNYYLAHPLFPLDKTVAMVNFDMIGHLSKGGLQLGGADTSPQFPELVKRATANLDTKVKGSAALGGSDHAGFYRKGIPVMFFFTGLTDLYHTPDDDYETIDVPGVVKTIDIAAGVLGELLKLPERPEYSKPQPSGRGAMAYLGIVPDYAGDADGLRVNEVSADSPAAQGKLQAGDVIIKMGDITVADIRSLSAGLRKYKAGQKVTFVVRRGDDELALEVTLGKPQTGG